MASLVADYLAAAAGLTGALSGLALLVGPERAAASLRLKLEGSIAAFYARTSGVRNLAVGALFLCAVYTAGLARAPNHQVLSPLGLT